MASKSKLPDTTQSPYFGACIWPIIWDVEGTEYQVTPHVHMGPPRDQTVPSVKEYDLLEHSGIEKRLLCCVVCKVDGWDQFTSGVKTNRYVTKKDLLCCILQCTIDKTSGNQQMTTVQRAALVS